MKFLPPMTLFVLLIYTLFFYTGSFKGLWIKADREALTLMREGNVEKALSTYENPLFVGAYYFDRGEFKKALVVYETIGSKEGFYNRGNTYVMLGKYEEAIASYKLALSADENYKEAKENLAIARARKALQDRAKEQGNKEGTGGKLGADEIRFDNTKNQGGDTEVIESTQSKEGSAMWLDRLETSPASFLKAKFLYQLQGEEK